MVPGIGDGVYDGAETAGYGEAGRPASPYLLDPLGLTDDTPTLLERGMMSFRAGKLDHARSHVSESRALFQQLGAREHRERRARVLAEIDEVLATG